jgi:hypothetical protein
LGIPDEFVPAIGDEIHELALALHVKEVTSKLNKGQVEDDDCNGAGGRVA